VATSGTVGTTVFNTAALIDHAYGRCRIARQEIVSENLQTARELLFLRLAQMSNRGIPLWAVEKAILPLYVGQQSVDTPVGTVNVLDLNLRRSSRLTGDATASEGTAENAFDGDFATACTQTLFAGWIQLELEEGTRVPMFGILPNDTATWDYEIQGSDDGVTFVTLAAVTDQGVVAGEWRWLDIENGEDWTFYRLQAGATTILDVAEWVLANAPNEVPLAPMNRNDYSYLPDKTFLSQPTQYWLDKQRAFPVITLWPAPNESTRFWNLVGYLQRTIQDVGSLVQDIEVRQSDYLAIMARLAADIALSDKRVDKDWVAVLQTEADREWRDMWDGESDDAPVNIAPNIGPYTR
jgi:hypothetical protein